MLFSSQAALGNFDWPEPLLIEAIGECYGRAPDAILAARLHTSFLHALVGGEARRAASLRRDLLARCAAHGLEPEAVEAADRAAFRELTRIVAARFRTSPRLRLQHIRTLRAALDQLPIGRRDAVAAPASAPIALVAAQAARPRAALRLA